MSKTKRSRNFEFQVVQISTISLAQVPRNISSFLPATPVSPEDSKCSLKSRKHLLLLKYRLVV